MKLDTVGELLVAAETVLQGKRYISDWPGWHFAIQPWTTRKHDSE
jgi:hypothetical protein